MISITQIPILHLEATTISAISNMLFIAIFRTFFCFNLILLSFVVQSSGDLKDTDRISRTIKSLLLDAKGILDQARREKENITKITSKSIDRTI